jgi:hypothetical protein
MTLFLKSYFYFFILFFMILPACTGSAVIPPTQTPPSIEPPFSQVLPSAAPPPTVVPPTQPLPNKATPTKTALPADPQKITFNADDGQELEGTYYPAAVMPAPVIVLMHWAASDQTDWVEIAFWLQNRGLSGNTPNPSNFPWLDPSWFPRLTNGRSYAVFTFTYRGCTRNGCPTFNQAGWVKDSQAAMKTASELEGVDPMGVVSAGASIGADGAPDGCYWLNSQVPGSCLGTLSFSPGDYLGIPYAQVVQTLQDDTPSRSVWCLYGKEENYVARICESTNGPSYQFFGFPGQLHGMELIQPALNPNPLQLFLNFLEQTISP